MTEPLVDPDGVVRLRRDLIATGLTDQQLVRLVRAGVLTRIRHGAYVDTARWQVTSDADRHRLLCRAVLARAHDQTALTHLSSVVERGIPVWGVDLGVVHTTREKPERAGRTVRDWVPHRGRLTEDDLEVVNGLTSDLVLRLADPRLESVGEDRVSYLCYAQGLPRPEPQWKVHDEEGTLVARLDFAWPEHGVFLEFDGRAKYREHRLEGETLEEFLMREKAREERVCLLTGWTCLRISWADLARPELLAARIRAVLMSRTGRIGA